MRNQIVSFAAQYFQVSERRWAFGFALIVILVTSFPYLLAYQMENEEWVFTGFLFGVEDGNSYVAKMLRGSNGEWLFRTPYTTEDQQGVVAFMPFTLLGKMAGGKAIHTQLVVLFHSFRLIGIFAMTLATLDFISFFINDRGLQKSGTVLATLGGGFGWLLVLSGAGDLFGSLPLDIYSPESFGFLSLYGLPHLAMARAFLLWGIIQYLRTGISGEGTSSNIGHVRYGLSGGLLILAGGIFQPLTIMIAYVLFALHFLVMFIWAAYDKAHRFHFDHKGQFLRLITLGVVSCPIAIYSIATSWFDPFIKAWIEQNIILSPHPMHYLAGYGLLLPLVFIGVVDVFRQLSPQKIFILVWLTVIPFLVFMPHNLQRRFADGGWVALVIAALWAVNYMRERDPKQYKRAVNKIIPLYYWCILPISMFTSVLLLTTGVFGAINPQIPAYRPVEEVAALQFLERHANVNDVVVSSYSSGNVIPAWAPVRVVIGHGPESANLRDYEEQIAALFSEKTTDTIRQDILRSVGARFIFWGPEEKMLGDWDPFTADYAWPIYDSKGHVIFELFTELPE